MADVALNETIEVVVVDGASNNGAEMVVNSDGTVNSRLKDGSGNSIVKGQATMADSLPVVISSDQTTVPVSVGLPTYLDKTFGYATSINQPNAGTDNPLVYIKNPSESGKTIYLKFISYGISVTNVLGTCRVWKNPTVSANGTSRTIVSFGSQTTAMELYTVPTVTSSGTLMHDAVTGQNNNSLLMDFAYEIQIAANSTILITGDPGSNNRQAEISVRWVEL